MFKVGEQVTAVLACAIAIALCAACGDDSSSTLPVGTGGMGQAGTTAAGTSGGAAGGAAGSSAGRGASGTGSAAGRGAAGSGAAGTGVAGRGSAGASGMNDDDAGVNPGTAGTGAAGSAGAAGTAAGSGGASGSAAGSAAGGAGGAAGSGMGGGATFTEVYAIFTQSCAGAACHVMATRPGEGLSMANKMTAYTSLVGVNAGACAGEKRVVAGDPAKSELLHTLERTQIGTCRTTPRMPEGRAMLAADQIAKVRSWIQAGALDN